jgi:N-acetylmuramic acid 6-phosphate etherase
LAQTDLSRAFEKLKAVDVAALAAVQNRQPEIGALAEYMHRALAEGGRIFFCGCGATGRLSLTLEFLWRSLARGSHDSVLSFMAGGDVALIRSIEDFEDAPHFGSRQLEELGFCAGDLLVASTEGGETPFVIGAAEAAAKISKHPSWFLHCNPDDVLKKRVERSRRVLDNPSIRSLSLYCGPMALSGSTRMQATTVLLLAAGAALLEAAEIKSAREAIDEGCTLLKALDYGALIPFTERESAIYDRGEYLVYDCPAALAVTVATDTTERAPTFSLAPFENIRDAPPLPSLCHLRLPDADDAPSAWRALLGREPRTLEWPEYRERVSRERTYGYDFSRGAAERRRMLTGRAQHPFQIALDENALRFSLDELTASFPVEHSTLLSVHLALKVLLNAHSTLVMGRLGRYESNIMTWVRPANNKLIDRTIRYARALLEQRGIKRSYEEAAKACFEEMEAAAPTESIVMRVVSKMRK